MPVIINFKVCDNAESCNALSLCPTGAFKWNDDKKTLEIDESKCIGCAICATSEKSCSVGAIRFASTNEEFEKIKKEIEDDPRTVADLMVDRYGADPINMPFYCTEDELKNVLTTSKVCFIEVFIEDSIECLIKSIPIKEALSSVTEDFVYRKVKATSDNIVKKFNITQFPTMLIFQNNELLGKVEGYYTESQKNDFINKMKEIVK